MKLILTAILFSLSLFARTFTPETNSDLEVILDYAKRSGKKIRVIGTQKSSQSTNIRPEEELPIVVSMRKFRDISGPYKRNGRQFVTIESGVTIGELNAYIADFNKTIGYPWPGASNLNVVGVVVTNSHGDSWLHPSVTSDSVVGVEFIDGTGKIHKLTTPQEIAPVITGLGMFGIVTKIDIEVFDEFGLSMITKVKKDALLYDTKALEERVMECDSYKIHWMPKPKKIVELCGKKMDYVPRNPKDAFQKVIFRPDVKLWTAKFAAKLFKYGFKNPWVWRTLEGLNPLFFRLSPYFKKKTKLGIWVSTNRIDGNSQEVFTYDVNPYLQLTKAQDYEITVPWSQFPQALRYVKNLAKQKKLYFPAYGISLRFTRFTVSNTFGHLAHTGKEDRAVIFEFGSHKLEPWMGKKEVQRVKDYESIGMDLVEKFGATTHIGKNSRSILDFSLRCGDQSETVVAFASTVKKYDPDNIFSGGWINRLLIGESCPN